MTECVEEFGGVAVWGDMPEAPAHLLTKEPTKALLADPMVREGWATLVGVVGATHALRFASETAPLWLRPDAAAGATGAALKRVAQDGFVPAGLAGAYELTATSAKGL